MFDIKAGQSKLKQVLEIIWIVAFIVFFIKKFEAFVYIVIHPGEVIDVFLHDPVELTVYMFYGLLLGIDIGGA